MTVITSENYWSVVFRELQEEISRNSYIKYLYISKKYDQAIKAVEDRIGVWYGSHALDNKVSLRKAYRRLPKDQLEQFHDMIELYLKYWHEELGYDKDELKVSEKDTETDESESDVPETLSDTDSWVETLILYQEKKDVSCYEALAIPIIQEIEKASHETSLALLALLAITGVAVHKSIAENLGFKAIPTEQVKKELLKSWAADDMDLYSRFNANKAKLSSSVKAALVKGFRGNSTVDEVIAEVSKVLEGGKFAAKRLVTTENTHFNCYSTMLAMKKAGYKAYKINAVIDAKTCDDCIAWDGDVYPINEYSPNVTAPPQHSHCRCYVTPANLKEIE